MTASTVVGRMLVAVTERVIATVRLGDSEAQLVASLRRDYSRTNVRRGAAGLKMYITEILRDLTAEQNGGRLPLDLGGTGFQRRVWKALQRIPRAILVPTVMWPSPLGILRPPERLQARVPPIQSLSPCLAIA
jgi:O6-methylguanine-DNA--protein-cysteine methyltransferase